MTQARINAISPFFIVSNVQQTVGFYCEKLGFEADYLDPKDDPFFAIVRRDGAMVFLKSDQDLLPLPNSSLASMDQVGCLCFRSGSRCACGRVRRQWTGFRQAAGEYV